MNATRRVGFDERMDVCSPFGEWVSRTNGCARSVVSGLRLVPFSCLSNRARRTHGRAQGAWRLVRRMAEEGHLSDRGQTDEWRHGRMKPTWRI